MCPNRVLLFKCDFTFIGIFEVSFINIKSHLEPGKLGTGSVFCLHFKHFFLFILFFFKYGHFSKLLRYLEYVSVFPNAWLKGTAKLVANNFKRKPLLKHAICHKPNQNRLKNKIDIDVCIKDNK